MIVISNKLRRFTIYRARHVEAIDFVNLQLDLVRKWQVEGASMPMIASLAIAARSVSYARYADGRELTALGILKLMVKLGMEGPGAEVRVSRFIPRWFQRVKYRKTTGFVDPKRPRVIRPIKLRRPVGDLVETYSHELVHCADLLSDAWRAPHIGNRRSASNLLAGPYVIGGLFRIVYIAQRGGLKPQPKKECPNEQE